MTGQIYQTGADSELLFLAWAALILPWVLASRAPWLWLFWLLLGNAALLLYVAGRFEIWTFFVLADSLFWAPLLFNATALVPWPLHRFLAVLGALYALQAAVVGDFVLDHRASAALSAWLQALYWAGACALLADEMRWRTTRAAPLLGLLAAALAVHCLSAASIPLALELGGTFAGKTAVALGLPLVSFACLAYLGRDLWRSGGGLLLLVALAGVLTVTWQSPGLAVGSTAMALGFANGRRWLLWLGGLVALAGIGRFYYFLEVDLLAKSGYLVLGGLLLLAARRLLPAREVANDA